MPPPNSEPNSEYNNGSNNEPNNKYKKSPLPNKNREFYEKYFPKRLGEWNKENTEKKNSRKNSRKNSKKIQERIQERIQKKFPRIISEKDMNLLYNYFNYYKKKYTTPIKTKNARQNAHENDAINLFKIPQSIKNTFAFNEKKADGKGNYIVYLTNDDFELVEKYIKSVSDDPKYYPNWRINQKQKKLNQFKKSYRHYPNTWNVKTYSNLMNFTNYAEEQFPEWNDNDKQPKLKALVPKVTQEPKSLVKSFKGFFSRKK